MRELSVWWSRSLGAVSQMAIPALKMNPARAMRTCLLIHSPVHRIVSPTSAFPVTWNQCICSKLEMLRYH
uniref:Secreted protein n=1 Tax=Felis catus TaxID=9685 RepID=A0ABI7YG29_FELCA